MLPLICRNNLTVRVWTECMTKLSASNGTYMAIDNKQWNVLDQLFAKADLLYALLALPCTKQKSRRSQASQPYGGRGKFCLVGAAIA